jgi:hypothetical protein
VHSIKIGITECMTDTTLERVWADSPPFIAKLKSAIIKFVTFVLG